MPIGIGALAKNCEILIFWPIRYPQLMRCWKSLPSCDVYYSTHF